MNGQTVFNALNPGPVRTPNCPNTKNFENVRTGRTDRKPTVRTLVDPDIDVGDGCWRRKFRHEMCWRNVLEANVLETKCSPTPQDGESDVGDNVILAN